MRQGDLCKSRAVPEGSVTDACQPLGQSDAFQRGAVLERAPTDALASGVICEYDGLQLDSGGCAAAVKQSCGDRGDVGTEMRGDALGFRAAIPEGRNAIC